MLAVQGSCILWHHVLYMTCCTCTVLGGQNIPVILHLRRTGMSCRYCTRKKHSLKWNLVHSKRECPLHAQNFLIRAVWVDTVTDKQESAIWHYTFPSTKQPDSLTNLKLLRQRHKSLPHACHKDMARNPTDQKWRNRRCSIKQTKPTSLSMLVYCEHSQKGKGHEEHMN